MKLKTLIKSILFSASVLLIGCNDLLDVEAENSLSGNIFTSDQNFEDALNGAYVNLGGIYDGVDGGELYGGDFQMMATLLSRRKNTLFFWRASEAPNYQDFMDKDVLDINLTVESNWRRAYETINIVNGILTNISNMNDASLRTRIEGEAHAIRGILYFELVRFWGPQYELSSLNSSAVPILLAPITDVNELPELSLATVDAVYTQAVNDLEDAEALLSNTAKDDTRINVDVCRAFLARIAMQQNDFNVALGYLNQVIPSYTLNTEAMGAFNNPDVSSEDVFIIQQSSESTSGNVATRSGLVAHMGSLPDIGFAAININYEVLANNVENSPLFAAADDRYVLQDDLEATSNSSSIASTSAYYNDVINTTTTSTGKFIRSDANIPVIRLAELLLSRAEANIEGNFVGDPIDATTLADLNAVRTRAGLPALLDTLTAEEFYDSLIIERNRELIFEGVYFHDLKRWEANGRRVFSIDFLSPLDPTLILPIPQAECDASPGLCD